MPGQYCKLLDPDLLSVSGAGSASQGCCTAAQESHECEPSVSLNFSPCDVWASRIMASHEKYHILLDHKEFQNRIRICVLNSRVASAASLLESFSRGSRN